jgi:hypothetical protein
VDGLGPQLLRQFDQLALLGCQAGMRAQRCHTQSMGRPARNSGG